MVWWRRSGSRADTAGVALGRGEHVLAAATETTTRARVAATTHALVVVSADGEETLRRRWLEVDRGSWESVTGTISITWVGGGRGTQWTFGTDERRFAEVFRDRVEASRVVDAPVVHGDATIGRAAIRKDLGTGELVPQLVLERSVRRGDTAARAAGDRVLADLREQVGL